jgi:hypothetical protein
MVLNWEKLSTNIEVTLSNDQEKIKGDMKYE